MSAIEMLTQFAIQSLAFLLIGSIVYLVTRWLHFRPQDLSFAHPEKAAIGGLVAILIGWLFITTLFFTSARSSGPQSISDEFREYRLGDVASQSLVALLAFGPTMLGMRIRGESSASAGISKHNLGGSILIGGLLGCVTIAGSLFGGNGNPESVWQGLTGSHAWALLYYAVVGFGEEFAYRGYLQTRLVVWLGRWQGWILTLVLMALVHIPQRIAILGTSPLEALLSAAALIPISLFIGFVMLRTGNIVAPGWRIPSLTGSGHWGIRNLLTFQKPSTLSV